MTKYKIIEIDGIKYRLIPETEFQQFTRFKEVLSGISGHPVKRTRTERKGIRFGNKIKQERVAKSLTQIQLGRLAGISAATVCSVEQGLAKPHAETRKRLMDALAAHNDVACK